MDDVVFSRNGSNADTGLECATWQIIHHHSPGGAAKLCSYLLSPIALFFSAIFALSLTQVTEFDCYYECCETVNNNNNTKIYKAHV